MKESLKRRDYHNYNWKVTEAFGVVGICVGIVVLLAYFFYRSMWALIPLAGVGILEFKKIAAQKAEQMREELALEFRECILAVSALLQAGYSVENAFTECINDMRTMYGERSLICEELTCIDRGIKINISLEELLLDLAQRSDCEDIEQFAGIFALAKRNGGNMSEIIRNTASRIGKKLELQQEIKLLLSGRKMELSIMKAIPFGILAYIELGNPGYFEPLYHNLTGMAVMTVCLSVYIGANVLGDAVMKQIISDMV